MISKISRIIKSKKKIGILAEPSCRQAGEEKL